MYSRMGFTGVAAVSFLLFFSVTAAAVPMVSNVTAVQRTDGSGLVDIHYDLSNGGGTITVELVISSDGGTSWDITPVSVSGDIGTGVTNGADKHIIWDGMTDSPDVSWSDARFRVTATDDAPHEITIMLPGGVPLVLVRIPAGTFMMGRYPGEQDSYANEDPQHEVTIAQDFYMGKYEITQQQWLAIMGSWPEMSPTLENGLGDTHPAYYLSWDDAKNFVTALNTHISNTSQEPISVRLPSEAEWEYAFRSGTATRFHWGDDLEYTQIGAYAWYVDNSDLTTHPVGEKLPNNFGLYDMAGNVWEWCEDDYHDNYLGAPSDGSSWIDSPRAVNRILRGCANNSSLSAYRSAFRIGNPANTRSIEGFRLAASISELTIMLPGDVPLELIRIPSGTFMMGRYPGEQDSMDREDPQHLA